MLVGVHCALFRTLAQWLSDEPMREAMTMPDAPEQLHATLRTIANYAGVAVTDADIEAVASAVEAARGRLDALRNDVDNREEPASVFSRPAGGVEV
ncbi:MAG TPA: hypothetical protein VHX16_04940 [Chloroflexota bacterium]|jgi:uncharacterized protein (DUF1684 family)|nr:hypothetical protein [Chloroflexota bacterium]